MSSRSTAVAAAVLRRRRDTPMSMLIAATVGGEDGDTDTGEAAEEQSGQEEATDIN